MKIVQPALLSLLFCSLAAGAAGCAGLGTASAPAGAGALEAARDLRPAPAATAASGDLYYVYDGSLHKLDVTGNSGGGGSRSFGESPAVAVTVQHTGGIYEVYGDPANGVASAVAILTPELAVVRSIPLTTGAVPIALAVNAREQSYVICSFEDDPAEFVIEVLMSSAQPNLTPQIIISQPTANLGNPSAMAVDNQGNVYVAVTPQSGRGSSGILIFTPNPVTGTPQLARTIGGPATGLSEPLDLALGADGNMYVANRTSSGFDILVFPMSASGNVAPLRRLTSSTYGATVALGSRGELYLGPGTKPNEGFAIYKPGARGHDQPISFLGRPFKTAFPVSLTLQYPWYEN